MAFLFDRIDYERTRTVPYRSRGFKLERMLRLAALLGHPEADYPVVHVAGTKGKGSTATMIAAATTAAGFRTGLYTSPHLERVEERFVVDGQQCNEQELVSVLSEVWRATRQLEAETTENAELTGPTYFEVTTAAALLHFHRRNVDCAVLEVGLGGRLDSTNICQPAVSVVTTISLDHTRQLGKTLGKIAAEKAGIIKARTPVVTGVRENEPFEVIESIAAEHDCPLLAAGREFDFVYEDARRRTVETHEPLDGDLLSYWERIDGMSRRRDHVKIGMRGRHQAANAAVALATLGQLQRLGWTIDEPAIRDGLAKARCPARFELLGSRPTIILDAAHNPASVAALNDAIEEHFPGRPRLLLFATSLDKDASGMLKHLLPHADSLVLTRYLNNPRARDPAELETLAKELMGELKGPPPHVEVSPDPGAAWQRVRSLTTPSHVICVTGSFFLAAEIRQYLDGAPS
ncbi:MAG: bifunctional folylpolyglutamate synthase/dihydrofolate synthase [Planctomycetota bacterium]